MSRRNRFLCSVPEGQCSGSSMLTSKNWHGSHKSHVSREDARRCYINYLLGQGYKQLSSQEFAPPDNGPILLINKLSRFGGVMRKGKEDRFMPRRGSGEIW